MLPPSVPFAPSTREDLPAAACHDPADQGSQEKTDDDDEDERRSPDADDPMHVDLVEDEYGEDDGERAEGKSRNEPRALGPRALTGTAAGRPVRGAVLRAHAFGRQECEAMDLLSPQRRRRRTSPHAPGVLTASSVALSSSPNIKMPWTM